mgnify:CR=1 FL=1
MGKRLKKLKKIRLHHEGTHTLVGTFCSLLAFNGLLYLFLSSCLILKVSICLSVIVYAVLLNFFQCPIRLYAGNTDDVVVAPADGRIVVVEEVEENEYFHDRRMMVSIFMSLFNVHANWFPVDGKVKFVHHQNGNFHKAWLPKASEENEHADIMLETEDGTEILCRQIAGAVARRIVTYAKPEEDCYIDEHLGFIKFGSRVDVYLPLGTEVCVKMGQSTTGDKTVIAKLK